MTPSYKFSDAKSLPFWFTTVPVTADCAPASQDATYDLAIVGGGFTGLWSALKARERNPDAKIAVLEGKRCGQDASDVAKMLADAAVAFVHLRFPMEPQTP
ncbi:MAG: hypothetical protein P8O12_00345 [Tateyamaria sp.]|nr:hypothetical protein [Tateyamaria sp.]